VLSRAHKPITVDNQKPTRHFRKLDVLAASDLASVFSKSAPQRGIEGLSSVDDSPMAVERINSTFWRGDIFRELVSRTLLEFMDELVRKSLVELEEELVFIAHGGRVLSHAD
jgi:hypothetical protein